MNPLVIVCIVLSVLIAVLLLWPFFAGDGGILQDASTSDDIDTLKLREQAILERWLRDEEAAARGEISATEWRQRQAYLTSRFVDVSRRISWLNTSQSQLGHGQGGGQ